MSLFGDILERIEVNQQLQGKNKNFTWKNWSPRLQPCRRASRYLSNAYSRVQNGVQTKKLRKDYEERSRKEAKPRGGPRTVCRGRQSIGMGRPFEAQPLAGCGPIGRVRRDDLSSRTSFLTKPITFSSEVQIKLMIYAWNRDSKGYNPSSLS